MRPPHSFARAAAALVLIAFLTGCSTERARVVSTAWLQQGECTVITAGGSGRTISLTREADGSLSEVVVLSGPKGAINTYGDWKAENKVTLAPGASVTSPPDARSDNYRVVVINHGAKPATVRILVDNADGCEIIQAPAKPGANIR